MPRIRPAEGAENPRAIVYRVLGQRLPGETQGAQHETALARTLLIRLLLETRTLNPLFDGWAEEPTLAAAIRHAEQALAARAQRLGLPSTLPLRDPGVSGAPRRAAAVDRAFRQLQAALATTVTQRASQAATFVEHRLPWQWSWLPELLLFGFVLLVEMTIYQADTAELFPRAWPPPVPAPALTETFTTGSDETVAEALQRWEAIDARVRGVLAAAQPAEPRGTMPASYRDPENSPMARYVGWLVRRDLLKESVRAIARSADKEPASIRHGIQAAKAALA
jgi:hypothetical protein